MAWESDGARRGRLLRQALPGLSPRVANSIVRSTPFDTDDIGMTVEILRMASDDDLLRLRNFGYLALEEVRAALSDSDYDPGQCNWVGEGVPA